MVVCMIQEICTAVLVGRSSLEVVVLSFEWLLLALLGSLISSDGGKSHDAQEVRMCLCVCACVFFQQLKLFCSPGMYMELLAEVFIPGVHCFV